MLRAMLVAPSDPDDYGKLKLYTVPSASDESGPSIVASAMGSDRRISEKENLLGQGGSSVYYGSVQVLPIGGSILYVRPLFVEAGKNYPIYTYMAVWYRGEIGFGPSLAVALSEVGLAETGGGSSTTSVPTTTGSGDETDVASDPGSEGGGDVIARIDQALREAQVALKAGDLATYQRKVDAATKLANDAVANGSLVISTTTTMPSTTTPSTTTPSTTTPSTTTPTAQPSASTVVPSAAPTTTSP